MPVFGDPNWFTAQTTILNNCYNYALDRIDNTFLFPGGLAGIPKPPRNSPVAATSGEVVRRAMLDGLVPIPAPLQNTAVAWTVALVIAPPQQIVPNGDFHWYRQDDDASWSHKAGQLPPTQTDALGFKLAHPYLAHRQFYLYFVGFFTVPARLGQACVSRP